MIIADGWKPGKLEHLLAFKEKYPDVQREHLVVALGSLCIVGDYRYVPILESRGLWRDLGLNDWDDGWDDDCRFLAVRKVV